MLILKDPDILITFTHSKGEIDFKTTKNLESISILISFIYDSFDSISIIKTK